MDMLRRALQKRQRLRCAHQSVVIDALNNCDDSKDPRMLGAVLEEECRMKREQATDCAEALRGHRLHAGYSARSTPSWKTAAIERADEAGGVREYRS